MTVAWVASLSMQAFWEVQTRRVKAGGRPCGPPSLLPILYAVSSALIGTQSVVQAIIRLIRAQTKPEPEPQLSKGPPRSDLDAQCRSCPSSPSLDPEQAKAFSELVELWLGSRVNIWVRGAHTLGWSANAKPYPCLVPSP